MEIKAKKSLGQNFLIDKSVLEDIVSTINPLKGDTIVEIGPGRGELTKPILASGAKLIVIEKDIELAKRLAELKVESSKLKIIEGDALEQVKSLKFKVKSWKLVGNIPYYITGYLFRIISELKSKPSLIVFMIQKEVAERICAEEGEMNLLAASIQVWAEPEIVRFVSRESFDPKPKVESAVIRLVPTKNYQLKTKNYYELLHIIFKQPRKTLFNNLRDGGISEDKIKEIFKKLNIDAKLRPQNLSIEHLLEINKLLK